MSQFRLTSNTLLVYTYACRRAREASMLKIKDGVSAVYTVSVTNGDEATSVHMLVKPTPCYSQRGKIMATV